MKTSERQAQARLIDILQRAHAGELAAALAYRGHARSVTDAVEAQEIREIERDELRHRDRVGKMLESLGAAPRASLEGILFGIGTMIGALCHLSGWFFPMYGAGRLERGNIAEYEEAAHCARLAGWTDLVEPLLAMAEVEWEHEKYFRGKAANHWLTRLIPLWSPPPPKSRIRDRPGSFRCPEGGAMSPLGLEKAS